MGTIRIDQPTPIQDVVLAIVRKTGRSPEEIYAVFDKADAIAAWVRPSGRVKEILVLFTDWTFLLIDGENLEQTPIQ